MATKTSRPERDDDSNSESDNPGPAKRCRVLDHDSYTVAWICALPLERSAACVMLDERHADLPVDADDSNSYTLGSIAGHNVVIACLPLTRYGNNSAAMVATNLKRSFQSIRIGLMVGIAGGVPTKADIRLGDVIIGTRVMQYDMGKITSDEGDVRMSADWRLPQQSLLGLVSKLRSEHLLQPSRIPLILEGKMSIYPKFQRPDSGDNLFQASYQHVLPESGCEACNVDKLVPRRSRMSTVPEIFHGAVASGNAVMRNGAARDRIAKKLDVVCYEMEAAGLMDVLPCLPIRGICDYADSHKSKEWLNYAAATAAACARELLEIEAKPRPLATPEFSDQADKRTSGQSRRREAILEALHFDQIDSRRTDIKKAHADTCHWFLKLSGYQRWLDPQLQKEHFGFLWIKGKPGAGKSTIMKFLYNKTKAKKPKKPSVTASFFFHARGGPIGRSVVSMYRSILLQLLEGFPDLQEVLDDMDLVPKSYETKCPPLNALKDILREAVLKLGSARCFTCFIDALDECDEQHVMDMVRYFEELAGECAQDDIRVQICFASRHYPYIVVQHGISLVLEDQSGHAEDLVAYTQSHLRIRDTILLEELRPLVLEKASGVFLWVVLVVDILNKEERKGRLALKKRLAEVPAKLSELFKDILSRDGTDMTSLLICVLWILLSQEPLSPRELHHAVWVGCRVKKAGSVDPDPPVIRGDDEKIIQSYVVEFSKGLAETIKSKKHSKRRAGEQQKATVQFIHESVRDFLIKDDGLHELWPDLGFDWQSEGHELLARGCKEYLGHFYAKANVTEDFLISQPLPTSDVQEHEFLAYACRNIFYHADGAANVTPQAEMLLAFSVAKWSTIFNHFEPYKTRKYTGKQTLLYLLAERGCSNLVKEWLRLGHTAGYEGDRYRHPFFAAWASGNKDTCAATLGFPSTAAAGIDVWDGLVPSRASDCFSRRTLLTWASETNRLAIAKVLLDWGCRLDEEDDRQFSPLMAAVERGHEEMMRFLLREGALDHNRCTLGQLNRMFHLAAKHRILWLMEILFQNGAEINVSMSPLCEPCDVPLMSTLLGCSCKRHEDNEVVATVDWMIRNGAEIEPLSDWDKSSKFNLMLRIGPSPDVFRVLTRIGFDWNGVNRNSGSTCLLFLINTQKFSTNLDMEGIEKLLDAGADANASDIHGTTPLLAATETIHATNSPKRFMESLRLIKLLLKKGANPWAFNRTGDDLLMNMIERSPPDLQWTTSSVIKLMIENGADVHSQRTCGRTPLAAAVFMGNAACVKLLLSYHASISCKETPVETTPVRLPYGASGYSSSLILESLELLVESGIDINHRFANGKTFLHRAAQIRDFPAMKLLISHGVRLVAEDADCVTPSVLLLGVERPELRDKVFEVYLKWLVSVVTLDQLLVWDSFVNYAACSDSGAAVKALIHRGVDVNAVDEHDAGKTALHVACAQGDIQKARWLLEAGALVDVRDYNGHTALTTAVERRLQDMTELLISYNANPHLCDLAGPLHSSPYLTLAEAMASSIQKRGWTRRS